MSFFYGLASSASSSSNGTTNDLFDTTVLPGHSFKDPYMTGTIIVDAATFVCLIVLHILLNMAGKPEKPRNLAKKEKSEWVALWRPTAGARILIWLFAIYLLIDIVTRVCIELRITVVYAFSAIEIPAKIMLMLSDVVLAVIINGVSQSQTKRLNLSHGWRKFMTGTAQTIFGLAVIAFWFGERISGIVMMVMNGFNWNRPDKMYYVYIRLAYLGVFLFFGLLFFITSPFGYLFGKEHHRDSRHKESMPFGKMPWLVVVVIFPAYFVRFGSALCFVLFFRLKQRPQNPHLELFRMLLICVPVLIILVTLLLIRRDDVRLKREWDHTQLPQPPEHIYETVYLYPTHKGSGQMYAPVHQGPYYT